MLKINHAGGGGDLLAEGQQLIAFGASSITASDFYMTYLSATQPTTSSARNWYAPVNGLLTRFLLFQQTVFPSATVITCDVIVEGAIAVTIVGTFATEFILDLSEVSLNQGDTVAVRIRTASGSLGTPWNLQALFTPTA